MSHVHSTERRFIIVSGLPGSGKSTLARRLGRALALPVIDKDDILEELFDSRGVGDDTWRRALSRESDVIFQDRASDSPGAVLVSFWRMPGLPEDSGTPADWLSDLTERLVHVRCVCPVAIAAWRFVRRRRHPGHQDGARSLGDRQRRLRRIAALEPLTINPRIDVDTSRDVDLEALLEVIEKVSHRT